MYPKVTGGSRQSVLNARLGPRSQQWKHLPPMFKQQLQAPVWWQPGQQLTLLLIAPACLTGLFMSLRHEVKCVGYWMAKSSPAEQLDLKSQHMQHGFSSGLKCTQWWKGWKTENSWDTMTTDEQAAINAAAAKALFLNPPVRRGRLKSKIRKTYEQVHACMCCKSYKQSSRFLEWKHGYPQLVLQFAGVTEDGVQYPSVYVPAHQLVAWLFLGFPPKGLMTPKGLKVPVVCHFDITPGEPVVKWEKEEEKVPGNSLCFPLLGRCLSKHCVCPMCLHFSTQISNAMTGKDKYQLPERKAKRKRQ